MIEATQMTLSVLDELGLDAYLKTSGGKGMHIIVPLARKADWDTVKAFAKALAQFLSDAAAGTLYRDFRPEEPGRQDLHRLLAQHPWRQHRGRVFRQGKTGPAGLGADHPGRTEQPQIIDAMEHRQPAKTPAQAQGRSVGGL